MYKEDGMTPISIDNDRIWKLVKQAAEDSGHITELSALSNPTFSSCVSLLADSIAMLGIKVYSRQGETKARVVNDPVEDLLKYEPNPLMSAFDWLNLMVSWLASKGNAISRMVRRNDGSIEGFYPIPTERIGIQVKGSEVIYDVQLDDRRFTLAQDEVLHFKLFSDDGIIGVSPITRFAKTIGWGNSLEKLSRDLATGGGIPPGILKHPEQFESVEKERTFLQRWKELIRRKETPYLHSGMEYQALGLAPELLQYVESMHLNTEQICKIWRIPPVFMGVASAGLSFSSIEVQMQFLGQMAILPIVRRIEAELNRKLFPSRDRFAEMEMGTLLRPETAVRFESYLKGTGGKPVITQNEARVRENLPPLPGGDDITPLNAPAPEDNTDAE